MLSEEKNTLLQIEAKRAEWYNFESGQNFVPSET